MKLLYDVLSTIQLEQKIRFNGREIKHTDLALNWLFRLPIEVKARGARIFFSLYPAQQSLDKQQCSSLTRNLRTEISSCRSRTTLRHGPSSIAFCPDENPSRKETRAKIRTRAGNDVCNLCARSICIHSRSVLYKLLSARRHQSLRPSPAFG